jgi:hypothetical protein
MSTILTKNQKKVFGPKVFKENGHFYSISAIVRYDDECGNGYNSFSITGEIWRCTESGKRTGRDCETCGSIHDHIKKHFPELAPFIKWHLTSSDGPMHYMANTLYHAGDKDSNGLKKGEFRQMKDRKTGLLLWEADTPDGLGNTIASETAPAPVTIHYKPYGTTGEGKERQLDYARATAVWPDATDDELIALDLKEKLINRLPQLLKDFQSDVESLGFTF